MAPAPKRASGRSRDDRSVHKDRLILRDVSHVYSVPRRLGAWGRGREPSKVEAVCHVSLSIQAGEIVGLAGESGSGKTTLASLIVALQQPSSGEVMLEGLPLDAARSGRLTFRQQVQMVFQDPYDSLNPRLTVAQSVEEPLRNLRIGEKRERGERVKLGLIRAGLVPPEDFLNRYPYQLSGGERQRVSIARAVVVEPRLLVADEPVSMLDVSLRAGILNIFKRLREELGMSLLYISHDLATIRHISDRVIVLYRGGIVEQGPAELVIDSPRHPYTELLLASVPRRLDENEQARVRVDSSVPTLQRVPNGCSFHDRCRYALSTCGWQGEDVVRLLDKRRAAKQGRPDALLDSIEGAQLENRDLVLRLSRSAPVLDVRDALQAILEESDRPSIAEAAALEPGDGQVRVAFPSQERPKMLDAGQGHFVACHLHEGSTVVGFRDLAR